MDRSASVSEVVACHLGLLQVLFMLPVDVLRNSFLAHFSSETLRSFRLTCREAALLIHTQLLSLPVRILAEAPVASIATAIRRFSAVTNLVIRVERQPPLTDDDVALLLAGRPNSHLVLQHVTTLTWSHQPFNHNTAHTLRAACPNLAVLKLHYSPVDCTYPIFSELTGLHTVSIIQYGQPSEMANHANQALASLFTLPKLQKLEADWHAIPWKAVQSTSLQQLKLWNVQLTDDAVDALADQVPQLSALYVDSVSLKSSAAGRFPNLAHLYIGEGLHITIVGLLLLQDGLCTVELGNNAIFVDEARLPFDQWPLQDIAKGLCKLKQVLEPSISRLEFAIVDVRAEAACELALALPVLSRVTYVGISVMERQEEFLPALFEKLPNVQVVEWDECVMPDVHVMTASLVPLPQLREIEISWCHNVTMDMLTSVAVAFGAHAVNIYADSDVFAGADLQAVNAQLADSGAASNLWAAI